MKSILVFAILFFIYGIGHASKNSSKLKIKSTLKRIVKPVSKTDRNNNHSGKIRWKNEPADTSEHATEKSKSDHNRKNAKLSQAKLSHVINVKVNKSTLKSKLQAKKSTLTSSKRQSVLGGDPSQQRLFHIDETGTLHRHEVGPEEYTTPEGKTETFSNDKLLTEENLVSLRPSQAEAADASTRQIFSPALSPPSTESSNGLPETQSGSPVEFPIPSSSAKQYYLMSYPRRVQVMYGRYLNDP